MTERLVITKYIEEGEGALTISKPLSDEYYDRFMVLYENAFGDYDFNVLTEKALMTNYFLTQAEVENIKEKLYEDEEQE